MILYIIIPPEFYKKIFPSCSNPGYHYSFKHWPNLQVKMILHELYCFSLILSREKTFFFCFLAAPVACTSARVRDRTCARAASQAVAVTALVA